MTDLFWPGDHRADALMSGQAFLDALLAVENAWLATLVQRGVAPASASSDLRALVGAADIAEIATHAERDGNPVTALVTQLRSRAGVDAARWLHRGLTSQDVVDTALTLCLRDATAAIDTQLSAQARLLAQRAHLHRHDPMLTRTLTQPALPGTAGLKFAVWLAAVLDAADTLRSLPAPAVQCGGAAGTLAAAVELAGSVDGANRLVSDLAAKLDLRPDLSWHTSRARITRAGDALATCCDAWGHIANDVAAGTRAEIGEFREGSAGGSSTMPHKSNPVLSVLLRRAALAAPQLAATLHAASAASVDERSDGGWHAEWATLRTLARHTIAAAAQATDLLSGLQFDADHAAANLAAAHGIDAEHRTMAELTGGAAEGRYLGAAQHIIDATVHRAETYLKETA